MSNADVNLKQRQGRTQLHRACADMLNTPLSVFQDLISRGADLNIPDRYQKTPLHLAFVSIIESNNATATNEQIEIIQFLVTQPNININHKDEHQETPMHLACKLTNSLPLHIYKLLIEQHQGDLNIINDDGCSPARNVVSFFNPVKTPIDTIVYLLTHPSLQMNARFRYGQALIHTVCQKLDIIPFEVFKAIVDRPEIDINLQDDDRNTPHQIALFYHHPSYDIAPIKYLCSHREFDVCQKNNLGKTFLHLLCQNPDIMSLDVFKSLLDYQNRPNAINITDNSHETPLHRAFHVFHSDDILTLEYLLKQPGVDLTTQNCDGLTCIDRAFSVDRSSPSNLVTVQYIIQNNLLQYASKSKNHLIYLSSQSKLPVDVIKYVCENTMIDYTCVDETGQTVLHCLLKPHKDPNIQLHRLIDYIIDKFAQDLA